MPTTPDVKGIVFTYYLFLKDGFDGIKGSGSRWTGDLPAPDVLCCT